MISKTCDVFSLQMDYLFTTDQAKKLIIQTQCFIPNHIFFSFSCVMGSARYATVVAEKYKKRAD
jgi:hypothetical protein